MVIPTQGTLLQKTGRINFLRYGKFAFKESSSHTKRGGPRTAVPSVEDKRKSSDER